MMKQAWRSYWSSLHPRYLRKAYDNGAIFPLIYWFVIYPFIMNLVNENGTEIYNVMALMFMRMIPFMVMEWSNINSKYLMPKAMYVSPMKEQERMEYINYVLLIKIGMTVFLGMCIEIVWGIFTGFHIGKVAIVVLIILSCGVASYISTKKHWYNALVMFLAIITMAFIAFLEIGAEESLAIFCKWVIAISVIILPVLVVLIIRKNYHATIAFASDYEVAFKVEGKVEPKQVKFDLFAKKE
ncbi:MAG: hypothetical protein J6I97_04690 [Agathobacter sp.]|nr:hypothetical protein [Agathobacter sp.]